MDAIGTRDGSARRDGGSLVLDVLCTGAGAALASAAVAGAIARAAGKGALQPLNATSHWLHGRAAGRVRRLDGTHSGVGVGTRLLSALFRAAPCALWFRRGPSPAPGPAPYPGGAAVATGVAATAVATAVDYLAMPRRLTPGWERAIGRAGVAAPFVGLGLAGGALVARRLRRDAASAPG